MTTTTKTISAAASGAFVRELDLAPSGSGPLTGLTFAVKDLIDLEGHVTGCGNPIWRDTHPPAPAHAVCVEQLLAAGARCLGKTVSDELAFGLDGENFFYGTPLNPRAPDRVPGGSSSGSASAVACGLTDFALGTDTGGSVRVPASNCGLYGFRPSHGCISLAGVNPLAPTFDTVGVLARSPEVLARAGAVLLAQDLPGEVEVGTVHVLTEALALADPGVREALEPPLADWRRRFGERVRHISLNEVVGLAPETGLTPWYETYITLQWAEIWSCLGAWIEAARPVLGPKTARNFELARSLDRRRVGAAARRREAYCRKLKGFLGPRDLLAIPTVPAPAPRKGTLEVDRTRGTYFPRVLSLTSLAGIGRLPQVALPLAAVEGVPVGLSVLASPGEDAFLLAAAGQLALA